MPTFELDVEVDEFMDELTSSEIREVIEWLNDRGYKLADSPLDDNLKKISENAFRLTLEEEDIINKIADRL